MPDRLPRLVALDDQVLAYLRDRGQMWAATTEVFVAVWGPCTGWPHTGCAHPYSYSQVIGALQHLERRGLVARRKDPGRGRRTRCWWRSLAPRVPLPVLVCEEEQP